MKASLCETAAALLAGMLSNDIANRIILPTDGFFEFVGIHTVCLFALWLPLLWFAGVIDFFLDQRAK